MKMKKWGKAILFLLPVLFLVAAVNWYVDSYAMLRITYDQIGEQMAVHGRNVEVWKNPILMTGICFFPV